MRNVAKYGMTADKSWFRKEIIQVIFFHLFL